jgi:hypothetical protein
MTTTDAPTTATSSPFRFLASRPRREIRTPAPLQAPDVRRVSVDGRRALAVKLAGKLADGLECLIDPETWEWVQTVAGSRWVLNGPDAARAFVATGAQPAREAAKTKAALVSVARIIAGRNAKLTGKLVVALNGSRLDLRCANLMVTSRAMGEHFRASQPLPTVVDGWSE